MPEGPDGRAIIIVKKVSGHGGHHGGSWKVAYADFVTSMMCLFLVLWLVNSASVVTKEKIASYFKRPGVFEEGSGSPLQTGGAGFLEQAVNTEKEDNQEESPNYDVTKRKVGGEDDKSLTKKKYIKRGPGGAKDELVKAARDLEEMVTLKRGDDIDKVTAGGTAEGEGMTEQGGNLPKVAISLDEYGLHLEIMDTPRVYMFEVASSRITQPAIFRLSQVAQVLAKIPNPMEIEGHTDGLPYRGVGVRQYDNWDLSVDRANAARRLLIDKGVKDGRVLQVTGFADTTLKVPSDPKDPSNRRITIKVRYTDEAERVIREEITGGVAPERRGSGGPTTTNGEEQSSTNSSMVKDQAKPVEETVGVQPPKTANEKPSVVVKPPLKEKEGEPSGLRMELLTSDQETGGRDVLRPSRRNKLSEEKYLIFDSKKDFFK